MGERLSLLQSDCTEKTRSARDFEESLPRSSFLARLTCSRVPYFSPF